MMIITSLSLFAYFSGGVLLILSTCISFCMGCSYLAFGRFGRIGSILAFAADTRLVLVYVVGTKESRGIDEPRNKGAHRFFLFLSPSTVCKTVIIIIHTPRERSHARSRVCPGEVK